MKNLLFVDDEPRVLQGLQRQLRDTRDEWSMNFIENGKQALDFMANNPVDVIVTDMMMPGTDGAQLLTEVMHRYPDTVRIVLSGHAAQESILRLVGPAHQYLSKPCNGDELRSAISRALALRELLANQQLKQLATSTTTLPAIPALYHQLNAELQKEDPSMEMVGDIIAKDIGMTSKIIQLVSSAFFGLPQPITSAHEAVIYLGLANVRALVLSIHVFSEFKKKSNDGFSLDQLADHSWMVGVFARRIAEAERCDPKIGEQCFLAGLLHDIGQLILATGMAVKYSRVLETARMSDHSIWETEQEEFGASHAEVGGYLLGLWGLPDAVVEAVAFHHLPAKSSATGFCPVIAVHAANALAHDFTATHPDWPGNRLDETQIECLGLTERVPVWKEKCLGENRETILH